MRYRNRSPEAAPNEDEGALSHARGRRRQRVATQSAVLPRSADGCLAPTMRMPNGARPTSDAALLLS